MPYGFGGLTGRHGASKPRALPSAIALPPVLVPPSPHSVVDLTMPDGAIVRLRRHGNPDGPRIALSHGNGLAIEAYFPFWKLLLADYDVVLFDVRNHGQNPLHRPENHRWDVFCEDFEQVFHAIGEAFGTAPVAGAFHSLSSIATLDQVLTYGSRWSPLILIDPPIFPPHGHELTEMEERNMREMSTLARRRPRRYPDEQAFADQLAARPAFARWVDGAHLLFAQSTLRPADDGNGFVLRCPREMEAQVYETNVDPTQWPRVGEIDVPIKVIGADPRLEFQNGPSILCRALAEEKGLDYTMIDDTTHFLQIERPAAAVAVLTEFLARHGHGPTVGDTSGLHGRKDQGY